MTTTLHTSQAIIGEPKVVEDAPATVAHSEAHADAPAGARTVEHHPAWRDLKSAATALLGLQAQDGSVPDAAAHPKARALVTRIVDAVAALGPLFPHDAEYLAALPRDVARWADGGFGVPDFLDSLVAFQPQRHRIDGVRHLVVFPTYTQNGSAARHVEAQLLALLTGTWRCAWPATPTPWPGGERRGGGRDRERVPARGALSQRTQVNAVFATLPAGVADRLRTRFRFYDWVEARGEVRWMCSFDTTAEDVDAFDAALREEVGAG